jgi:hypothetical protein
VDFSWVAIDNRGICAILLGMNYETTARILGISQERARLVEAYLLLQYGRLSHLADETIVLEYNQGGISACIDLDPKESEGLAKSFGL